MGVADEAVRGIGQSGGEEAPGQQASEHHQRVRRRAVRGEPSQFAEDDGEHHHCQERTNERPGGPDHRLLVTHRDIAPSQDPKKFAVLPQVTPVVPFRAARLNNQFSLTTEDILAQDVALVVCYRVFDHTILHRRHWHVTVRLDRARLQRDRNP